MAVSLRSEDKLSDTQRVWLGHIKRQQESGQSIAAYVRQQGLASSTFYAMRQRLSGLTTSEAAPPSSLFQAVSIAPSEPLRLSLTLPDGLQCDILTDVTAAAALLRALARKSI